MTNNHGLVNDVLIHDEQYMTVTAKCKCGWISVGHLTTLAASAAFLDHQNKCQSRRDEDNETEQRQLFSHNLSDGREVTSQYVDALVRLMYAVARDSQNKIDSKLVLDETARLFRIMMGEK